MSNINNISAGHLDRLTGTLFQGAPITVTQPSIEDATAVIRQLDLTPADCEMLLFVIACRLVAPLQGMTLTQLKGNPLMAACEILDGAADEISNIKVQS